MELDEHIYKKPEPVPDYPFFIESRNQVVADKRREMFPLTGIYHCLNMNGFDITMEELKEHCESGNVSYDILGESGEYYVSRRDTLRWLKNC